MPAAQFRHGGLLHEVVARAGAVLGPEHRRVLALRQRRAAILVVGGDFRTALPEFAVVLVRTIGDR